MDLAPKLEKGQLGIAFLKRFWSIIMLERKGIKIHARKNAYLRKPTNAHQYYKTKIVVLPLHCAIKAT